MTGKTEKQMKGGKNENPMGTYPWCLQPGGLRLSVSQIKAFYWSPIRRRQPGLRLPKSHQVNHVGRALPDAVSSHKTIN